MRDAVKGIVGDTTVSEDYDLGVDVSVNNW